MAWTGTPLNTQTPAMAGAGGAGHTLRPPEPDAWGPGMALAILAHALLVAALAWGVAWRNHDTEPLEAEVWSAIPEAEAPPPPPPLVVPRPDPATAPPPEVAEPVPDLVIAKRKPPKDDKPKPKPEAQVRETFDSTPFKPRKADPTQPPPDVKAQQLKAREERDKAARELAAKEQAAKDKAAKEAQAQAEQAAALEAQRLRNLNDIVKRAGGGQSPSATGQAARSTGASEGYKGRLRALFKRNLRTFAAEDVNGNPEVVVEIVVAAGGNIMAKTVLTSSGVAAWDDAVLRAIDRTEVLPADETGRVPPRLTLGFRPKDD